MTRDQIIDLLSVVVAYDNRHAGQGQLAAWTEAADRGHWTYDLALDAIHGHYAESRDWIMPADVTKRVRAAKQDQRLRAAIGPPQPEPDPEAAARHQAIVNRAMGWTDDRRPDPVRGALGATCPHCHAAPRSTCTRPGTAGRRVDCPPHPSRWDAARAGSAA